MKSAREKLELFFECFGELVCKYRMITIIGALILAGSLISQLPNLRYDGTIEGFLHEEDAILQDFNASRRQFGQDGEVIIALKPDKIFNIDFLQKLKSLHLDLEKNVPFAEDITSMLNARYVQGRDSLFIVEDLLYKLPKNRMELAAFKSRVMANKIYKDLLISSDGKYTTVTIRPDRFSSEYKQHDLMSGFMDNEEALKLGAVASKHKFLTQKETYAFVQAIEQTVDRYRSDDLKIYVSGSPLVSNRIVAMMQKEMPLFTRLCAISICIALMIITRRLSLVFLPLFVIIITLLSTFGLMAAAGKAIKPPTQVLISILIVAGICDSIHLLAVFVHRLNQMMPKKDAMIQAIKHCGTPCVFTTLTTAAGMLAFISSDLSPVADLGIFGAAGTLLALFFTFTLIPSVVSFLPLKPNKRKSNQNKKSPIDRIAEFCAMIGFKYPLRVVGTVSVLVIIAIGGMTQLHFFHNALLWLPEKMAVRQDTDRIDDVFKGSVNLEVILDTGVRNGIHNRSFINRLDQMTCEINKFETDGIKIGKAIAVSDVLKEINQALNQNNPDFYSIPSQELISQEFMLFENSGSEDLEDFVDSVYRQARFTVRVPWLEAKIYTEFIAGIKKGFVKKFDQLATVTTTGMMTILNRTSRAVMQSMANSYILSVLTITGLMLLLLRNVKISLLSMLPNFLPVLLVLGMMGYFRMPLDTFSMLIGSIALGLLVDDTVHFFHNFNKFYIQTDDVGRSIELTCHAVSIPVFLTSTILVSGFGVYVLSQLSNVVDFGIIMMVIIILGLLCDFFLSPALLTLMHQRNIAKSRRMKGMPDTLSTKRRIISGIAQ